MEHLAPPLSPHSPSSRYLRRASIHQSFMTLLLNIMDEDDGVFLSSPSENKMEVFR